MQENETILTVRYSTALGDVDLDVRPITRKAFEALGRKHRKVVWNKDHQKETEINPKTYYPELYSRIVKTWRGLTEEIKALICLQRLNNGTDPKQEVPFNAADLVKMARTNQKFAEYIEATALNFEALL